MHVLVSVAYGIFFFCQFILALYLLTPFVLFLLYGVANLLRISTPFQRKPILTNKEVNFAVIVTAHQEVEFVPPLVDSLLKQTYPYFHIYVVADDCNTGSLHFADDRISILAPGPPLHSKIKSIHYAIDRLRPEHEALIILDVDNLLHPAFLATMNLHFQKGYQVVQADFKPKNTETHFARMDAIGDMFNFFIEREARMRLGLSSAIWGAGTAIDLQIYKEVEYRNFLGGFDKRLQSHLVRRVHRIAFAPQAILYDEKISSGQSLETQRTRWINAYFKYFGESWAIFSTGIKRPSFNLLYFGFHTLRPPLFLVLAGAILFAGIDFFTEPPLFYTWLGIFLSFLCAFIGIVVVKGKDPRYTKTLLVIPLFVLRQMAALFKLKKASRSFLKTRHSHVIYIDELLKLQKDAH